MLCVHEHLPTDKEQYKANLTEVSLIARMALQASLDSADMVARSIATSIVMQRVSWLQLSGFPKEVQVAVEDLTFQRSKTVHRRHSCILTLSRIPVPH